MITVPSDVPKSKHNDFIDNYQRITNSTDRIMLFAADQKMEHLNKDFYGPFIHPNANNPLHIFEIASKGRIGALAAHLGLISRYAQDYKSINYIVKLNGKTDLIKNLDPLSKQLWSVSDVINYKNNSNLKICGVGYTVYLGSEYEAIMLEQASQIVLQAHQNGLVAILWVYPRGKNVSSNMDLDLTSGSTGSANSLGADFVKIKPPTKNENLNIGEILKIATKAAGNTKVICSGGETKETKDFLYELYEQINVGNTSGNATGRNIFQRSLDDAIAFTNAISSIVFDNKTHEEAMLIYEALLSQKK